MVSARRRATAKVHSNINVTPMVDVMLVLLIIFMIVTPMLDGPEIQLAEARSATKLPDIDDDAIVVAVTRKNEIYLGTELTTSEALLGTKIHDMLEKKVDKRAFLRADKRSRYGLVTNVVDVLRSQGVAELGLLTEPHNDPTSLW